MASVREDLRSAFNPFPPKEKLELCERDGRLFSIFGTDLKEMEIADIWAVVPSESGEYGHNRYFRIGLDDDIPSGTHAYRLFTEKTNAPENTKTTIGQKVHEYPSASYLESQSTNSRWKKPEE